MIAAVYARKSSDSEAGVQRQVEIARDFITARGWSLDPAHVYSDNDVSGAVFERPGLSGLLLAIAQRPLPFDALVVMGGDRLGREMGQTLVLQQRILAAGVRVFFYQSGEELVLNTPTDKLIASVNNFAAESYRHEARIKTKQALQKKFEQGHAVAQAPYGFANERNVEGSGSYVRRVEHPTQAATIRLMFQWAGEDRGARWITRQLNAEHVEHPRAGHVCRVDENGVLKCKHVKRGQSFSGWTTTTVRHVLKNPAYKGVIIRNGQTQQGPALVTPETFQLAQDKLAARTRVYAGWRGEDGRLRGRSEAPENARHLLGGMLVCVCGSKLIAIRRTSPRGKVRAYWACSAAYKLGSRCPARKLIPYTALTESVLAHFAPMEADVWFAMVAAETERWMSELQAQAGQADALRADVARLDLELGRLSEGIALGGNVPALVTAIQGKQRARDEAAARLEHAEGQGLGLPDLEGFLTVVRSCHDGLSGVLRAGGAEGRRVLKALLQGPIRVEEVREQGVFQGWKYEGTAELGKILDGMVRAPGFTKSQLSWVGGG
jgi:DNA invertase Pin-like site-specific DNA recombinase